MIHFRPFKALVPQKEWAKTVSSPPYDVLSEEDIQELAQEKNNFVHVIRGEVDLPDVDPYDSRVYEYESEELERLEKEGILEQANNESYYIYEEIYQGRRQRGIVGLVDVEDYKTGAVMIHEKTRVEKEEDRTNHFRVVHAQTEPVFFFHPQNSSINTWINAYTEEEPLFTFEKDGLIQSLWQVEEKEAIRALEEMYLEIPALYVADGHHRTASASKVAAQDGGIMAVVFAEEELLLLPYHRVIKGQNLSEVKELLSSLPDFSLKRIEKPVLPQEDGSFVFFDEEESFLLIYEGEKDKNVHAESLDVSILQHKVLEPIFQVADPRTDPRLDFFGGFDAIEMMQAALKKVDGNGIGILLHPVSTEDIRIVSDEKDTMPPKSTWFEPKLQSGLFINKF